MQQVNPTQEAKSLNVRLEQEDGEWIAVLPPHPDLKGDEEVGFPAPTEQEALDEARAYRAIEQSKVFKFSYDEGHDEYIVTFGDTVHAGKLLAPTYRDAQKAYADMINREAPKAEEPTPPEPKKQRRKRSPNGSKAPDLVIPQAIAPDPQFTSGIGDKPGQLPPVKTHEDMRKEARPQLPPASADRFEDMADPWTDLNERITRLENILHASLSVTAKALEELNKR